jgi:hypothetical protein
MALVTPLLSLLAITTAMTLAQAKPSMSSAWVVCRQINWCTEYSDARWSRASAEARAQTQDRGFRGRDVCVCRETPGQGELLGWSGISGRLGRMKRLLKAEVEKEDPVRLRKQLDKDSTKTCMGTKTSTSTFGRSTRNRVCWAGKIHEGLRGGATGLGMMFFYSDIRCAVYKLN